MILPCSPDPCTYFKSIPFSFAIFLANGEANILPSFTTAAGVFTTGVTTAGAAATGVVAAGSALTSAFGALVALTDFTIPSMSKPG